MGGYSEQGSSRFSESHARTAGVGGGGSRVVFRDDFHRADDPTGLGSPWVEGLQGTIGIVGNEATALVLHTSGQTRAVVDVGTDIGETATTLPGSLGLLLGANVGIGIMCSYQDPLNWDSLTISANGPDPGTGGIAEVIQVVAGVVTLAYTLSTVGYGVGTVWSVRKTVPAIPGDHNMIMCQDGVPVGQLGAAWTTPNTGHFAGLFTQNTPAPFAVSDLFTFSEPLGSGSHDYGAHRDYPRR